MFVRKGYLCDGMFKLSINNDSSSIYIVESLSLWHERLAHVNFKSLKYMSKHGLITYSHDNASKCKICIQAKMTKKLFSKVGKNSKLLQLVRFNVYELNGILTKGGNRYFINFIGDDSRFTYIYLIKSKDETFDVFKCYKSKVENQKEKKIKFFAVIEVVNIFLMSSLIIVKNMTLYIKQVHLTPHNRMVCLKEKNMTLVDMLNVMILNTKLSLNLLG